MNRQVGNRREDILTSTRKLIRERGFEATTIEAIVEVAGASNGSIYHHFDSKQGVLAQLYLDALGDYQKGLLVCLRAHVDDARGGVVGVVVHHLRWTQTHPDDTRLLFDHRQVVERSSRREALRQLNRELLGQTGEWLRAHRHAGKVRDLGAAAYAVWLGPAQEVTRHWLNGYSRVRPTQLAGVLGEAAWRAFQAKSAAE